jgi:hypothetical protein
MRLATSAVGAKRTFRDVRLMSAFGVKRTSEDCDVRERAGADIEASDN